MSKQRCGTCRFFQESPLSGSGWCHHPLRRTTNDLLLMVRKNELACRDGWSNSLWEPGVWEPEHAAGDSLAESHFAGRPVSPANEREIASAMLASGPRPADERNDDRVLSEIGLPPDDGDDGPDPVYERPERQLDTRSAMVRARENIRERRRVEPRSVLAPSGSAAAGAGAAQAGSAGLARPANRITTDVDDRAADDGGAVAQVADVVFDAPEPPAADAGWADDSEPDWYDDSEDAFGEDGEVEHPASGRQVARGLFGGFGRFLTDVYGRTTRAAHPEPAAPGGEDRAFAPEAATTSGPEPAMVASVPIVTDPVWAGDPEAEFDTMVRRLEPSGPGLAVDARRPPTPGPSERVDAGPADSRAVSGGIDDGDWRGSPTAAGDDARWGVFDLDGDFDGPMVVPSPDLAPDLPRICRTCRDFRPAEHGGRGWCANRWAFTHRRVVDGDDAAPCESSFGSWWLPVDDAWMAVGDVSEHGRPTPLLDQWLPGHREEERQRRGT